MIIIVCWRWGEQQHLTVNIWWLAAYLVQRNDEREICGSHFVDCRDPPWLFTVKGMDGCGHVTDDFGPCCDEFFFDFNILKTKDTAISFRGLPPTVIEGKEIELVDSYKYLLLMANCASRNIPEQSVRYSSTRFSCRKWSLLMWVIKDDLASSEFCSICFDILYRRLNWHAECV